MPSTRQSCFIARCGALLSSTDATLLPPPREPPAKRRACNFTGITALELGTTETALAAKTLMAVPNTIVAAAQANALSPMEGETLIAFFSQFVENPGGSPNDTLPWLSVGKKSRSGTESSEEAPKSWPVISCPVRCWTPASNKCFIPATRVALNIATQDGCLALWQSAT
jgi:hypothetical protein